MSSKFAVFCERVMEAGWLSAAVAVPLFFDIYSSRVFEPDKITLLRSIAFVVAIAWLAKLIETGFADFRGHGSILRRLHEANPLTIPVLLLVGIYIVSTITSVAQYVTIWGSYQRLQGTYSMLSYITIFAAMLHALKTRAQLERLLTVIVLTSLPVAAYGWLQHFRLDPLPWGGDVSERIASAEGNSIFVGAYLIMVLPITVGRWLNIVSQVLREPAGADGTEKANGTADETITNDTPHLVLAGCYTFIIAFQALAIYWTFSRGAWIGLMAGMFVFLFLFGVRRRATWFWGSALGLAVFGIVFLLAINLPNTPFSSFKNIPGVGRLGTIFDESQGTNQVRFLIWQGAAQLVAPHDPIGFGQYTDVFNAIRPLIGYGPESMYVAYNEFYPPDLAHLEARNASPDRSHNEMWDSLVNTGAFGFVIYITLFGSVFYLGFKWLGLAGERRDLYLYIALLAIFGAIASVIAYQVDGHQPRLIGVALPVGIIFGLLTYLVLQALVFKRKQAVAPMDEGQILLMAIIGAVIGHFAEIHFGIAIASTRLYFWMYAALLVLVGYRLRQPVAGPAPAVAPIARPVKLAERVSAFTRLFGARAPLAAAAGMMGGNTTTMPVLFARKRRREKFYEGRNGMGTRSGAVTAARGAPLMSSWANSVLIYGLILGVLLQIMVFNFLSPNFGASTNTQWIFLLFIFTGLVGTLVMTAQVQVQHPSDDAGSSWLQRYLLIGVIGLSVMALYALLHLSRLGPSSARNVVDSITIVADTITVFYLFFFVLALILAVVLMQEGSMPNVSMREPFFMIFYLVLAIAAILVVKTTNLDSIRADIFYKQGLNFDGQRQWDGSIAMYKEAISLAPDQDFYYLFFGRAYLEKAKTVADAKQRQDLLNTSLTELLRARDLNPLNTDHSANLARLYRTWAEVTTDPVSRTQLLNQSVQYYEQAQILSPHNAQIYNEFGQVYTLLGQTDKALAKYQQSMAIDSQFSQTYLLLGDVYLNKSDYDNAATNYQAALKYDSTLIQVHSELALVYARQNKFDQAISENLIVLGQQPTDLATLRNVALLYQQSGKLTDALSYAQRALAVATDADKPALSAFIAQIQAQLQTPK